MTTEHSEKFKIRLGLFVLVGFLLFVAAIFIIGRQAYLFDPVFKVSSKFDNVSGLLPGNNVRFSGLNVGIVDAVTIINDSTVQVDMLIKTSMQEFIKADAGVRIGSDGLIGDRMIMISPGTPGAPVVQDGQFLHSYEPVNADDVLESIAVSTQNAERITTSLAEILEKINSGDGIVGRLIQDTTMAGNISSTIENLESSSAGLDENMKAVKANFLLRGYFRRKEKEKQE
jgi:phospholipid/cholesterol/gamma-HCH transport system substrate-binding protein